MESSDESRSAYARRTRSRSRIIGRGRVWACWAAGPILDGRAGSFHVLEGRRQGSRVLSSFGVRDPAESDHDRFQLNLHSISCSEASSPFSPAHMCPKINYAAMSRDGGSDEASNKVVLVVQVVLVLKVGSRSLGGACPVGCLSDALPPAPTPQLHPAASSRSQSHSQSTPPARIVTPLATPCDSSRCSSVCISKRDRVLPK